MLKVSSNMHLIGSYLKGQQAISMIRSFSVTSQYSKKINRTVFPGHEHEHGILQRSLNITRKAFENCLETYILAVL